jgi:hypothetical protein
MTENQDFQKVVLNQKETCANLDIQTFGMN